MSITSYCFAVALKDLKESSSERKGIFLFKKSVQISPCGFVCEREERSC